MDRYRGSLLDPPPWRHASCSSSSSSRSTFSRGQSSSRDARGTSEESRLESREDASLLCQGPSTFSMQFSVSQGLSRRAGFFGIVAWCALLAVTCLWPSWQVPSEHREAASSSDVLELVAEDAQRPPIVWTWGLPGVSCDKACQAEPRLRSNGLIGCCREDAAWPQSAQALVSTVLTSLRMSCSMVESNNNFDPSTAQNGQCLWNAKDMGNRCKNDPGPLARRFCACSLPWGPENTAAELAWISLAGFDELAVCNDGSPAGYYFRRAVKNSGQERVWLVMLNGGGQCYSPETCRTRSHNAKSSSAYPPLKRIGGIYAKASPVHESNLVFVPYCSSDGYVGNIAAEDNPTGFHFRGAAIVQAVMRHLVETQGLTANHLVIFGGVSSGARGAMIHLDRLVAPRGPLPRGTRVLGFLDSPLWIDQATLTKPRYVFKQHPRSNMTNETVQLMELSNASGVVLTPECLKAVKHHWQCWFGMYRLPLLRTPYVLTASQYDQFQLAVNLQFEFLQNHKWPDPRVEYEAWADEFAAATRAQLARIVPHDLLQSRSSVDTDKEVKREVKVERRSLSAGVSPFTWLSHWMQRATGSDKPLKPHSRKNTSTTPEMVEKDPTPAPESRDPSPVPGPREAPSPAPGPRAVLSWSCYNHAQSFRNSFFFISAGGMSQADVLRVAVANVTGTQPGLNPMPVIVEGCGSISCGQGCGKLYRC